MNFIINKKFMWYHQREKELLKKYIVNSTESEEEKISFFIVSGQKWLKKSEFIKNLSKEILWDYFINDFLYIQDFSQKLWKTHNIPVEKKEGSVIYKTLVKDYSYQNIGTREMNNWLVQSSFWKTKIIFIENIERMTWGAINAFLKACEEPLKWRIIIASTSNKSRIIDTVLSRAITINVSPFGKDELEKYCIENEYFQDDSELRNLLISDWSSLSFLEDINKVYQEDKTIWTLFKQIPKLQDDDIGLFQKISLFEKIKSFGYDKEYIDMIIIDAIQREGWEYANKRLEVKKMYDSIFRKEHIFLCGLV